MEKKKINEKRIRLYILVAVLMAMTVAAVVYLSDGYEANETAVSSIQSGDGIIVKTDIKDNIIFMPEDMSEVDSGFIFYTGGKVDNCAYAPLMKRITQRGIMCVILNINMNMAILDIHAADGVREDYPTIKHWYVGGHSLGGSVAAIFLEDNSEGFEGMILMAAYSSVDLSKRDLRVLSIYGDNDRILNMEKYEKYSSNLPQDFTEYIILGGCHSYFGSYGIQKGEGDITITPEEQWDEVANVVSAWIRLITAELSSNTFECLAPEGR